MICYKSYSVCEIKPSQRSAEASSIEHQGHHFLWITMQKAQGEAVSNILQHVLRGNRMLNSLF